MKSPPDQITLQQWQTRYGQLKAQGLVERFYSGPLGRHVERGDKRLCHLKLDNSPAALALWNLLLTENQRLRQSRCEGKKIIGAMKDLGTVPVMAYSFDNMVAFYPDGAWWTPCLMQQDEGLFDLASRHGLDDSFCPVRAMLGAFINQQHFPIPDRLVCSAGAVCDDFSAIAQQVESLGFPIYWWEMPRRRHPANGEQPVDLANGLKAPLEQVRFVRTQLAQVLAVLEETAGRRLTRSDLANGIKKANRFRTVLHRLRVLAYTADPCPIGSLEMLLAEMLALHYCSDYTEALLVLEGLLDEVYERVMSHAGVLPADAARLFWVNPPADLRAMNLLEKCGGRVCGTDYLFTHTLSTIAEDLDPLQALAQTALADSMVGPTQQRAECICRQALQFGAEGVIISRIPGASHCALEGRMIAQAVRDALELPVIEVEVPTLCDSIDAAIRTRLEALIETIKHRRAE